MDSGRKPRSGHPGTPMSLTPVSDTLWQYVLRCDPTEPRWPGRDRGEPLAAELDMIDGHTLPGGWDKEIPVFEASGKDVASRESSRRVLPAPAAGTIRISACASTRWARWATASRRPACARSARASFMDYMELPVLYIFTHDSIGVGEDGPSHQLVEPPPAPILGREPMPALDRRQYVPASGLTRGACMPATSDATPDVILIATGTGLGLSVDAYESLKSEGIDARLASMPCWELFEQRPQAYRDGVMPPSMTGRVVIEQAAAPGRDRYAGASASLGALMKKFGFTPGFVSGAARQQAEFKAA